MKSGLTARQTPLFDPVRRNQRARIARLAIGCVLTLLTVAFFNVQIVHHDDYAKRSTSNQVRTIPLAAPRGILYDRDGEVIAENLPAYSASLLPPSEEALARGMERLASILDIDTSTIAELQRQYRLAPGRPILLDGDLDYRTLSMLEELRSEVPGLLLQPKPRRHYPAGPATAHLTGYVAQIGEGELAKRRDQGYAAGDLLGTTGLERMYEAELRGQKGAEYLEVDAMGRRVGPWRVKPFEAPLRGHDLWLTVDLDLQRRAAEIFPQDKRGAVVALDPRNGEVLLLYSHPSYDPNLFSGRLSREQWSWLSENPERPLLDRTVQARYAPGSVFKLATAAMAMSLGVVVEDEIMDVPCRGGYQFGSRWFGCHAVHGWATLQDAIITSCDTYFYQLGLRLGLEELTRLGTAWQFGERTGIDLPNESVNLFPASTAWYDERYGAGRWGSGVVLNLSIGQGEIAVTPLKMAQFVSAIVNGGELLRPHLVRTGAAPVPLARLPLSRDQYAILRSSLSGVVNDWRGTAYQRAHYAPLRYTIGGKSGTTEHAGAEPHAWFVAMGPMENPEIVVAVLVEEGGSGSAQSPLAIDLIQTYLDGRRGRLPEEATPPPPVALSESGTLTE
jgi:penicillin-binding protein 2